MIVATYTDALTLMLQVNPVTRIQRLTPQGRKQERSQQKQHQKASSFASMLDAMVHVEASNDEHTFDAFV